MSIALSSPLRRRQLDRGFRHRRPPERNGRSVPSWDGVLTYDGTEHPSNARAGTRGGRRGVPRAHRPIPARAEGPLLPDPRLGAGRRGPRSGDALGGVAGARAVRRTVLRARLALPDRDEPLPERAPRPLAPTTGGAPDHGRGARAHPLDRAGLARAISRCPARGHAGPLARAGGPLRGARVDRARVHRRSSEPAAPSARGARAP